MSANVLFHNVAKRRLCVHIQRLSFFKTLCLSSHVDNGEQKREEEERESTLLCKHSSYYQTQISRSFHFRYLKTGKRIPSSLPLNPTFSQQGNSYSISSRNTLLNMSISESESNQEALPTPNTKPSVSADPRSFQKCRPDYSNMTHDISQRSSTLNLNEALLILNKVTILKNNMGASDITSILDELSQIPLKDTAVVRRDPRFSMLLQYSVVIMHTFTPQQLLDILKAFVNLDLPRSHSVLASYEAEFCERASEMNLHQLLLAADLWRCLVRNVPQYHKKLYENVSQNLNQMSPPELVQLIYIIGESRGCPETLVKSIESLLMRHLNELKPEELGSVCLGLFKAQTSLSERAVQRLVDRSLVVVKAMSDFGIVNLMKYLRFSYLDHLPWLEAMGVEVPRRAPQMEAQGLMHIILGFSALHYRDDRVLLAVAKQLPNVINQCRSKDAAKMLWAFGSLGFLPSQCPDLYPSLTALLRERLSEFQRFPEHLLTGLLGLAFAGLFPEDLLSLALSEEFVDRACKYHKLELNRDLFTLDGTVELELPESTIPRLNLAMREEMAKKLWDFAQSEICQKLEVLEAESMLQKLLGGEMFVRKHMILPHSRSIDLEVHLDQNDQPVPVSSGSCQQELASQNWEQKSSRVTITDDILAKLTNTQNAQLDPFNKSLQQPVPLRVEPVRESVFNVGIDLTDDLLMLLTKSSKHSPHPKDSKPSVKRLAVQVTNRNHYCYRTKQLLGLHALKRRHLTLAGYRVVELPHWEWFPLLRRSQAEKLAYLHCKIFNYTDFKE